MNLEELIETLQNKYLDFKLGEEQKDVLLQVFSILINKEWITLSISGAAGSGKSSICKLITRFLEINQIPYVLATPTHKAKGVLANYTERDVTTIHQLLQLRPNVDIMELDYKDLKFVSNTIDNSIPTNGVLIVDECSMISNNDMLKVLKKQDYKLVILAGDVFQIESIKYGNWFSLSYYLFKNVFVYELMHTNRTEDKDLLELWKMVRDNDDNALNKINSQQYSSVIDFKEIFNKRDSDEIILCLNYDGLYGINNINKVLQEKNDNIEYNIGVDTFKKEDPIVFNDCPRFRDLYNNLKGRIKNIEKDDDNDCVWFTILVEEVLYNSQNNYEILESKDNQTLIRLYVRNFKDTNDDDDARNEFIIPFNLAYAVSIHKAQGLEYNSVKIIITSNVEDEITKNIFYTAITRAKKYLKIFWSAESQIKIFDNMKKRNNNKGVITC